jgi:ABC-type dipeptide/oligopeptide/nickel transport system permease component
MLFFIARRLGESVITLILVSILVFSLARLSGDATLLLLPPDATEAERLQFLAYYGLDRSYVEQYLAFAGHALQGDFGQSFRRQEPAMSVAMEGLGPTLKLAGAGMLLSILIGLPIGIFAARASSNWPKRVTNWYASLGQALPPFWTGLTLVMLLALWFPLFPTGGYGDPIHFVLPAATLAISTSAAIAGLTLANMQEALRSDFVQLERVLGLSDFRIVVKHALRNAALPIVTYFGLQFGLILGGAIVTERVFSWPGIGQAIVTAILARDYPVVQAIVLLIASMFLLINLVVDILYTVLDPRLRK